MFNIKSILGKINLISFSIVLFIFIQSVLLFNKLYSIGQLNTSVTEINNLNQDIQEFRSGVSNYYISGLRIGLSKGNEILFAEHKPEYEKFLEKYNFLKDRIIKIVKNNDDVLVAKSINDVVSKLQSIIEYNNKIVIPSRADNFDIKVIDDYYDSIIRLFDTLDDNLQQRVSGYNESLDNNIIKTKKYLILISCFVILLVLVALFNISKLIRNYNIELNNIANSLAKADVSQEFSDKMLINIEIKQISESISKVKQYIEKAARLQTMLDNLSLPVMLCDKNFSITYINKISEQTLRKIEHLLPVKIDNIIGTSIDVFHKNPSHQRGMLMDYSKLPHKAVFSIGPEWLSLNANALKNLKGEYDGAFVDWRVVTQEKMIEEQNKASVTNINQLIASASSGDLSSRIDLTGLDGVYLEISSGINKLVETVSDPITQTIDVLDSMSHGILYKKLTGDHKGMFGKMQSSINAMIDKLSEISTQIKNTAYSVKNASNEIASGSTDLSSRTENQASSLEETASSMEELTETVQKNSQNAANANKVANDTRGKAEKGGEVASNAVTAMSIIEKSSQKISDIIGVIDEIAFQTNLLALNAAVEAARAGDAGKGFAVVASEVRTLAGRSASASKEIKKLIEESASQVNDGAVLVKQAGDTLTDIVASVKEVASLVSNIAAASNEQSAGIKEINTAILQMDEMTQQNAALVEENTAAVHSLVEQANKLNQLISFFRTSEHEVEEKVTIEEAKPTVVKKPASVETKKVATQKPVITKTVAPQTSSDDDGWKEF